MSLRNNLYSLKGKAVVIRANGILYRGILLDISEENVFIRHQNGHAEIPMDRIQSMHSADSKTPALEIPEADYFKEFNPDDNLEDQTKEKPNPEKAD